MAAFVRPLLFMFSAGALMLTGCKEPEPTTMAPTNQGEASAPAAAAPVVQAAAPEAATAERQLIDLERQYARALMTKDRAFLMNYYAPDWHGGNWMGFWTKSTMLKSILDERYVVKSMDLSDFNVRVVGNVGIVQAVDDEVTSVNGKDTSGKWSFTDVFEWRDGRWVAVASHTSEVKRR
jgi:hypothetical protein